MAAVELQSASIVDQWDLGILYPQNGSLGERTTKSAVPSRYRIRDDVKGRTLTCVEAPTVTVRAERGFVVTAAQARNYRAGAIFLDGAAQGGPFVEVQKELYNLDHHEGCIRPFTLATCEQAMVLIRRVVDLRKRDWTVFANDGDLDTVFALWTILNHFRINDDAEVRFRLMPLLRLEGAIDTHGLGLQDMAALPPDLFHATSATLKQLQDREAALKSEGTWYKVDLLEYIAERLQAIDGLIYSPKHFDGLHEVEELARVEIANGSVAVACRSDAGIYELEQQLRKLHGDRLGILILQNEPSAYTLRQVNQMLPATLEQAYQRLNLMDPAVRGSRNRWGGSVEIGGSPRGTGTRLTPVQITETVRQAFRRPTLVDILCGIGRGLLLGVAAMLPLAVIFLDIPLQNSAGEEILPTAVILSLMLGVLFLLKARQARGLYGWRSPAGLDWLTMLPAALIGAAAGGIWIPGSHQGQHNPNELTASALLLLPMTVETVFRGLILGDLAWRLPIQKSGGPWFVSWPAFISGALYALMFLSFLSFTSGQLQMSHWFVSLPAAVMFGTALGMARERSESIVAPILLHWLCVAALLLVRKFFF